MINDGTPTMTSNLEGVVADNQGTQRKKRNSNDNAKENSKDILENPAEDEEKANSETKRLQNADVEVNTEPDANDTGCEAAEKTKLLSPKILDDTESIRTCQ